MNDFESIDSKYRFVIIASKRAKEILKGAKPRIKTKSKNAIRIAQSEVKLGLVDFEIIPTVKEEIPEAEERVFLGEHVGGLFAEDHEAEAAEKEGPAPAEETEDLGVDFSDEFEGPADGEDEDKESGEDEGEREREDEDS